MADETDTTTVPVFPVPRGVPVFSADDIASLSSYGDLKFDHARRLIADYRAKGLLLVGRVGAHRTYFYNPLEVAIFKMLTELSDFGVCDEGLQAAALGCRAWSADNPAPEGAAASPLWQAAIECWRGAYWGLAVTCWRSDQGCPRHFAGFCHKLPNNPCPRYLTDDYQPHVMTSILLHKILNPLHSRMLTLLRARGHVPADGA